MSLVNKFVAGPPAGYRSWERGGSTDVQLTVILHSDLPFAGKGYLVGIETQLLLYKKLLTCSQYCAELWVHQLAALLLQQESQRDTPYLPLDLVSTNMTTKSLLLYVVVSTADRARNEIRASAFIIAGVCGLGPQGKHL